MDDVITRTVTNALDISHSRLQHSLIQMKEDMMKQLLSAVNLQLTSNPSTVNTSMSNSSKSTSPSDSVVTSNNEEEIRNQIKTELDNLKMTTLLQIVSIINKNNN